MFGGRASDPAVHASYIAVGYDLVVRGQAQSCPVVGRVECCRSRAINLHDRQGGPMAVLDGGAGAFAMVGGSPAVADWEAQAARDVLPSQPIDIYQLVI